MDARCCAVITAFLALLRASLTLGMELPIPDEIPDRIPDIPDRIPDIPDHLPAIPTLPPNIFQNLTVSVACNKALVEMFGDHRSQDAKLGKMKFSKIPICPKNI